MKNYVLKKWYKGKNHRMFAYPDDIDEELVPMLDVFNNIPGVRTEFSCSGHGYDGWYVSFQCASDFMHDMIVQYFTRSIHVDKTSGDWIRKVVTHLTYDVEPSYSASTTTGSYVPERKVTIWCNELGKLPEAKRRKEYMRICEYFATFTPRAFWKKSVQEFDYKEDLKNEKKDNR